MTTTIYRGAKEGLAILVENHMMMEGMIKLAVHQAIGLKLGLLWHHFQVRDECRLMAKPTLQSQWLKTSSKKNTTMPRETNSCEL